MISKKILSHIEEVTDGKKIWYIAQLLGFVMEVDLNTNLLRCIWRIPDFTSACSYRVLFYDNEKLYIFPYYKDRIYVYDFSILEYKEIVTKNSLKIMSCIKRENYIYAFGETATVVKYNINNSKIEYLDMNCMKGDIKNFPSKWFWQEAFINNNNIYIPVMDSNLLMRIDSKDFIFGFYLGKEPVDWMLQHITYDKGRFHAIYGKGKLNEIKTYVAEYEADGALKKEEHIRDRWFYQKYPFVSAKYLNGKWITLPFGRNQVLLESAETSELLCEIENGTECLSEIMPGMFWCGVWVNSHMLYSINQAMGEILLIDINKSNAMQYKLEFEEVSQEKTNEFLEIAINKRNIVDEIEEINLEKYINYICSRGREYA